MKRAAVGLLLAAALCAGCHAKADTPTVPTSELNGIDSTLNSVEADVNNNG